MRNSITFGIVSTANKQHELKTLENTIQSIWKDYLDYGKAQIEIIIVGGLNVDFDEENIRVIQFDETIRPGHITRKKNIIAQEAKYDTIVFLHDYIEIQPGFLKSWCEYEEEFDVAVNRIHTYEGLRHSDWVLDMFVLWKDFPELNGNWNVSLPYEVDEFTHRQYISGNFWVAKKQFMLDNPLDENLVWGDAEDIEWSTRIRPKTKFKINTGATVRLSKPNKWAPKLLPTDYVQKLRLMENR